MSDDGWINPQRDAQGKTWPEYKAEAESLGRQYRDLSESMLVGYVADPAHANVPATLQPVVQEMQRRLLVALRAFTDSSVQQSAELQRYNTRIEWLTWAMFTAAIAEIVTTLIK